MEGKEEQSEEKNALVLHGEIGREDWGLVNKQVLKIFL